MGVIALLQLIVVVPAWADILNHGRGLKVARPAAASAGGRVSYTAASPRERLLRPESSACCAWRRALVWARSATPLCPAWMRRSIDLWALAVPLNMSTWGFSPNILQVRGPLRQPRLRHRSLTAFTPLPSSPPRTPGARATRVPTTLPRTPTDSPSPLVSSRCPPPPTPRCCGQHTACAACSPSPRCRHRLCMPPWPANEARGAWLLHAAGPRQAVAFVVEAAGAAGARGLSCSAGARAAVVCCIVVMRSVDTYVTTMLFRVVSKRFDGEPQLQARAHSNPTSPAKAAACAHLCACDRSACR